MDRLMWLNTCSTWPWRSEDIFFYWPQRIHRILSISNFFFLLLQQQIDESNAFGNTALHVACFNGQDAVVSELIDYGANVSQPNNKGFTPLHFAAASTHGALCLEFLVNNGADVNVQVLANVYNRCVKSFQRLPILRFFRSALSVLTFRAGTGRVLFT